MTKPASILVVDDEPIIRETLVEFLQQERFAVKASDSGEDALAQVAKQKYDVILCDINLPGLDGLEVLERVMKISPETFVVLMTAYATVESAIEAFQCGAHDYLMKPVLLNEVHMKLRRLLAQRDLLQENRWLRRELNRSSGPEMIVGKNPRMREAFAIARKVGPTPSTVLILGESGTGKELMARAVHDYSGKDRFLAVNCAAIPHEQLENQLFGHRRGAFTGAEQDEPGMFTHAGDGTLFLDEIAELPLATQSKLLRAIEQKEILPIGAKEPVVVSARIIAATNKNLADEVTNGRFRDDLYYRLNVVTISLPPLRERREDLPDLVEALLARHAKSLAKPLRGVSHTAMQLLLNHGWRGNIRELDNALQRAAILGEGPFVEPHDLPADFQSGGDEPDAVESLDEAIARFEKRHLERMLRVANDKRDAARRMNISVSSLYRKIEQHGLAVTDHE